MQVNIITHCLSWSKSPRNREDNSEILSLREQIFVRWIGWFSFYFSFSWLLPFAIYSIDLQFSLRSFKESPTTSFYEKLGTYSTGQEGQRNRLMIVLHPPALPFAISSQSADEGGWLWVFLTAPMDTRQTCICYQESKEICVHISVLEVWKCISFQAVGTCDRISLCWCLPKVGGTAAGSWRVPGIQFIIRYRIS